MQDHGQIEAVKELHHLRVVGEDQVRVGLGRAEQPVAVAQVGGSKGQRTLATHIDIDSTEAPGTKHTIKVYYARGGKPITLAEKAIVLN